ncbi:MAG: acyltransferase family protein [Xanthobacteraceae bacterium]
MLLDAMRGLAALVVMSMHMVWMLVPIPPLGHFYLAVDFFFMLSGFVLANAYQERLAHSQMGFKDFVLVRLKRLYPLTLLGGAMGYALYLATTFLGPVRKMSPDFDDLAYMFFALTTIPNQILNNPWPFNGPSWSLFFEFAINFIWAAFLFRAGMPGLIVLLLVSAAALTTSGIYYGNISGGMPNVINSLPRVFYSFFMGILLHRLYLAGVTRMLPKVPAWVTVAAMLAVFVPSSASVDFDTNPPGVALYGWSVDLFACFIVFPLVILIGAATEISSARLRSIFLYMGVLSFPLYITHDPIGAFVKVASFRIVPDFGAVIFLPLAIVAAIVFAALADYLYDRPIQRWLQARKVKARSLTS